MADREAQTRQYIDAINRSDWATITAMVTDTTVHHHSAGESTGATAIVAFYKQMREELDWTITVDDVAASGNWSSTLHTNTLRNGAFDVCTAARFDGDVVAELWTVGMPSLG